MVKRRVQYDAKNDLYTVLQVKPTANPDELKLAFRARAKVVHPDLNPEKLEWAKAQFQKVNDAYEILSDPLLRSEYDHLRVTYFGVKTTSSRYTYTTTSSSTGSARSTARSSSTEYQAYSSSYYRTSASTNPSSAYEEPDEQPYSPNWKPGMRGWIFGPYRFVIAIVVAAFIFNIVFIAGQRLITTSGQRIVVSNASNTGSDASVAIAKDVNPGFVFQAGHAPSEQELISLKAGTPAPDCNNVAFRISYPVDNMVINNQPFDIRGTVRSETNLVWYTLEIESMEAPSGAVSNYIKDKWILSPGFSDQVLDGNGLLVEPRLLPTLASGYYTIRLRGITERQIAPCEVHVRIP